MGSDLLLHRLRSPSRPSSVAGSRPGGADSAASGTSTSGVVPKMLPGSGELSS